MMFFRCIRAIYFLLHMVDLSLLHISSERNVRLVISQISQYSRHYIYLLSYSIDMPFQCTTRLIENDGYSKCAAFSHIFGMFRLIGMIGCDHKQRIVEPGFMRSLLKKTLQRIIRITNTLMNRQCPFGKLTRISFGYYKRMMGRSTKKSSCKRLTERRKFICKKLDVYKRQNQRR